MNASGPDSQTRRQISAITTAHSLAAILLAIVAIACASCTASIQGARAAGPVAGSRSVYFPQRGIAVDRVERPKTLWISSDGSLWVSKLGWKRWTPRQAAGRGIAVVNDCNPNCAEGHLHRYTVIVRLAHPHHACGHWFYRRLELLYPHGRPAGVLAADVFRPYRAFC